MSISRHLGTSKIETSVYINSDDLEKKKLKEKNWKS